VSPRHVDARRISSCRLVGDHHALATFCAVRGRATGPSGACAASARRCRVFSRDFVRQSRLPCWTSSCAPAHARGGAPRGARRASLAVAAGVRAARLLRCVSLGARPRRASPRPPGPRTPAPRPAASRGLCSSSAGLLGRRPSSAFGSAAPAPRPAAPRLGSALGCLVLSHRRHGQSLSSGRVRGRAPSRATVIARRGLGARRGLAALLSSAPVAFWKRIYSSWRVVRNVLDRITTKYSVVHVCVNLPPAFVPAPGTFPPAGRLRILSQKQTRCISAAKDAWIDDVK